MNLTLPDWVPWWVPLVLLLPVLLYGLAFLFMPFSVIGLKSRLEAIEARLDEIQNELRRGGVRGGQTEVTTDYDDIYVPVAPPRRAERQQPVADRPPVQPPRYEDDAPDDRPPPPPHMRPVRRVEPQAPSRQEPRVSWPRS